MWKGHGKRMTNDWTCQTHKYRTSGLKGKADASSRALPPLVDIEVLKRGVPLSANVLPLSHQ